MRDRIADDAQPVRTAGWVEDGTLAQSPSRRCSGSWSTFWACSSAVTAKACSPVSPLATKYMYGVSSGKSTAWMEAKPGFAIGPGGSPSF